MLELRRVFLLAYFLYSQLCRCQLDNRDVGGTISSPYTILCADRKDISPCTCQPHENGGIIKVTCRNMTSFTQITQALRNKIDKANRIQLIIELSNLEDLPEKKFTDLDSHIAELSLFANDMGVGLSTKSFEGIHTVTGFVVFDTELNEFPGSIFEHMPYVSVVSIHGTYIRSVSPSDFKSLNRLSSLIMKGCNLTFIESNTFPPKLININLSDNYITNLNNNLRNKTLLKMVYLRNNQIESLEEQLPDYTINNELIFLDVSSNKLTSFPKSFINLHSLQHVIASMNQIENLDNVMNYKGKLEELDLSKNRISQLSSSEFEGCSSMINLNLSSNELTTLNGSLLPLQSLQLLNLTRNKFTEFSLQEIYNLKNLTRIVLTHNKLQKFNGLTNDTLLTEMKLQHLDLQFNELEALNGSLAAFKNLKYINISYNRLTVIPSGFLNELIKLELLDVSHNQLLTLNDISKAFLPSLQILHATSNKITELTQQPNYGFTSVCFMHLQNNKIKVVRPEFFERNQCIYNPGRVNATLYVHLEGNSIMCHDDIQEIINVVESRNNTQIVGQCELPHNERERLRYNIDQSNNTDGSSIIVVTL